MFHRIAGLVLLLVFISISAFAANEDNGKQLFKDNCKACHNVDMKTKLVGPGLGGSEERWADYPKEDLFSWIRNAQALIDKGHPKAVAVHDEHKSVMTPLPHLTDEEITDILAYIDGVFKGTYGQTAGAGAAVALPANFDEGKGLFKDNCKACHNVDMKTKLVGPGLGGSEERWADYPKEDLYAWIRNAPALIDKGHPKAKAVFEEFDKLPMTPFTSLTDDQITAILSYIDAVYTGKEAAAKKAAAGVDAATTEVPAAPTSKPNYTWLYLLLFAMLGLLAALLWHFGSRMEYRAALAGGEMPAAAPKPLLKTIFGKPVLGFLGFAVTVLVTFVAADRSVALGRSQGYQPEQPINFSHKIHAGDNKIDCEFCHDGARRSRHSNIPEGSTCIKCHAAIKKGSKDGTQELTKIYASLGWNPNTGQYIDNYDAMSEEDIEKIFKKWIRSQNGSAADLEGLVNAQWQGVKSSLTNPHKPHIQGGIEWVRVHNLPDHVYFNHSQHVNVGGLECQTCHGKVEEMDVLKQSSPLSMGWCINCHRESEVGSFKDNPYYESYPLLHEKLKDGTIDKVTVEDIGGLECQKCHY